MKNYSEYTLVGIAIVSCLVVLGILSGCVILFFACNYAFLLSVIMQQCWQNKILIHDPYLVITITICITALFLGALAFIWGISNNILKVLLKDRELSARKELLEKIAAKSSDKHEERTDD
ncbi:MAG: hypothetical protein MJ050_01335 [Phascolarctobacterium sp.]|nr:hypothetical protein [Phascolarctobacterium sp.]